jgi:predicted NAD/FAD-binding protein
MAAAIWSSPTERIRDFPFLSFARFFNNHGLLDLTDRPQWRTVRGGSHEYVQRMLAQMRGVVHTGTAVERVRRTSDGVEVQTARGERMCFDAVVLGCHGDQALALIESPSRQEQEILGAFRYQPNRVYVHQDPALMPKRRRVWASWNYLRGPGADPAGPVTVTYWMNSLQDLPKDRDVFVRLNPLTPPRPETGLGAIEYRHPVFDGATMAAQARIGEIQGRDRLWFAGAWLGYGFHEDGLRAAVDVAGGFGVRVPWPGSRADTRPRAEPTSVPSALPGPVGP